MKNIDELLNDACPDQRAALKTFAESGDLDALAAEVHYESCPICEGVLEGIMKLREDADPKERRERVPVGRVRAWPHLLFVAVLTGLISLVGYTVVSGFLADSRQARTEISRQEIRILIVRMPGRPDVCVAGFRGHGGYGPTFIGAARCTEVEDRVEADEDLAWHLREYAVMRIRGTDLCLAHAAGQSDDFTLPCGSDD